MKPQIQSSGQKLSYGRDKVLKGRCAVAAGLPLNKLDAARRCFLEALTHEDRVLRPLTSFRNASAVRRQVFRLLWFR